MTIKPMTTPVPSDARPAPRGTSERVKQDVLLGLYAVPGLVLYLGFLLMPVLFGLYYAFTSSDGISQAHWIGGANFVELLSDADFRGALLNTVLFAVVIIAGENLVGLGLALLLNRATHGTAAMRAVFFAPALLSTAIVALVWGFVFSPLTGVVRTVLGWFGVTWATGDDLLGNPHTALLSVALVVIWQFAGYVMVIYLAGLKNVPADLLEAAALDGATARQRFRHITLPLLRPATSVALTISIVGNLRLFDQVWLLTGGGPAGATETVGTLIYRTAFNSGRFGYAAAQSVVITVAIVFIVVLQRTWSARGMQ